MGITRANIKNALDKTEKNLEFCWKVLTDMKELNRIDASFITGLISFQDKLATTIFNLQQIRDSILIEEKRIVKNKVHYKYSWFVNRLRRLSSYKDSIDIVVNVSKALGDAYAHFFYQNDLELLTEHLTHQRVVNHTAGIGELGELEFIKNYKHIETQFTLFHGITNCLRYGDFSFIDLHTMSVSQIGELKTKKIDDETLQFTLSLLKRGHAKPSHSSHGSSSFVESDKRKRQILGIAKFLLTKDKKPSIKKTVYNKHYCNEIQTLVLGTKVGRDNYIQCSEGLSFACVRLRKVSLYGRLFLRKDSSQKTVSSENVTANVTKLMKPSSNNNSITVGSILYNSDYSDKNRPGAVPLFWTSISTAVLKQIYFGDCAVISLFNPVHLIEKVISIGFTVESAFYSGKGDPARPKGVLKDFDLFISYITNHLMTEDFVIEAVNQILSEEFQNNTMVSIRPIQQLHFNKKRNR